MIAPMCSALSLLISVSLLSETMNHQLYDPARPGTVSVLLEQNRSNSHYVRCSVSGTSYLLLVDTGCGATVISAKLAKKLRLVTVAVDDAIIHSVTGERIGGVRWATLQQLKIGAIDLPKCRVLVGDWPILDPDVVRDTPDGLPILGILGSDFFIRHSVSIDYNRDVFTFRVAPEDDYLLLRGRWRSISAEYQGKIQLTSDPTTASEVVCGQGGILSYSNPPRCEYLRVLFELKKEGRLGRLSGFSFEDSTTHTCKSPKNPGLFFSQYEVAPDRLVLIKRDVDKTPPTKLLMSTSNDPHAVLFHYVRVGSIPDGFGRTAADYWPWTSFAKRHGYAADGPYRIGNYDYSLNRDLTVTAVEVGGPTTITWDLEGSRIVRRGPRSK